MLRGNSIKRDSYESIKFDGKESKYRSYRTSLLAEVKEFDAQQAVKCLERNRALGFNAEDILVNDSVIPPKKSGDVEYIDYMNGKTFLIKLFNRTLPEVFKEGLQKDLNQCEPNEIWKLLENRYGSSTPVSICNALDKLIGIGAEGDVGIDVIIDNLRSACNKVNKDVRLLRGEKDFTLINEQFICLLLMRVVPRETFASLGFSKDDLNLVKLSAKLKEHFGIRKLPKKRTKTHVATINALQRKQKELECRIMGNRMVVTKKRTRDEGAKEIKSKKSKTDNKCFYCFEENHRKKDCSKCIEDRKNGIFRSNIHKKPKTKVSTVNSSNSTTTAKTEENDEIFEFDESLLEGIELTTDEEVSVLQSLNDFDYNSPNLWILDGGAGLMITNNKSILSDIRKCENYELEFSGGNTDVPKFIGTMHLKVNINKRSDNYTTICVPNVLLSTKCTNNIVSEFRIQQAGWKVMNGRDGLFKVVMNRKTRDYFVALPINGVYQFIGTPLVHPKHKVCPIIAPKRDWARIVQEFHLKLNHAGWPRLARLLNEGAIEGIPRISGKVLHGLKPKCLVCDEMKMTRMSYRRSNTNRSKEKCHTLHTDTMQFECKGVYNGINGYKYILNFVCEATTYKWVYPIKSKKDVLGKFRDLVAYINCQFDGTVNKLVIKRIKADLGTEFTNANFRNYCNSQGIELQFANVECPEENGLSERYNRTLSTGIRCLLGTSFSKNFLWPEAAVYVTDIENRLPSSYLDGLSSYEKLFDRVPEYDRLPLWGSYCFAYIPLQNRKQKKLSPRAVKCRFIGLAVDRKAYKLIRLDTNTIYISRDVRFITSELERLMSRAYDPDSTSKPQKEYSKTIPKPKLCSENNTTGDRPPKRICKSPVRFRDYVHYIEHIYSVIPNQGPKGKIPHPRSLKEAFRSPYASQWREAIKKEYDAIIKNKTYELVELPPGRKALGCKWVLTVKYLSTGAIERFKARLVVLGMHQIPGLDYDATYAPVARHETLKLILALACIKDWHIHQIDVSTAFLNGTLDEEIYMKQPQEYVIPGKEHLVCKLRKSLYGLKQAPLVWYKLLHSFLVYLGFSRCDKEFCLYAKTVGNEWVFVVVYVDDITITSSSIELLYGVKEAFAKRFQTTDLGEIHYLLKMEICRDRKNRILTISQRRYIEDLIARYGQQNAPIAPTPQSANCTLEPEVKMTEKEVYSQPYKYRELVGALQYLVRGTRPDIANIVRELSKFLTRYNVSHWKAALRVLRYLKGSSSYGLVFQAKDQAGTNLDFELFTDASFGNKEENRRSVTGYLLRVAGAVISARSARQNNISLCTAESELIAASEGVRELEWVWILLEELKISLKNPIPLWCDNMAAIASIKNAGNHSGTKHIEIRNLYVREVAEKKRVEVKYIKSENQTADILTKALATSQFLKLRSRLGVLPVLPKSL